MHEAIGQRQHQGRVELKKLVGWPHFYGVAALEGLEGEATIVDGKVTVTRVDAEGQLKASQASQIDESATLLVGAYVPAWTEHKAGKNVAPDDFDKYIADQAKNANISLSEPFVFTVEGEFRDVRFHVINGACPLHARLKKIELPKENQPFEAELQKVRGTIVGIYAKDAVGDITHPATSTHMHLVFKDEKSGKMVTGHLEQVGLTEGTTLRLPKAR
jgi:alpha-acetolactate decarboxylase